jgi:hypothetical protein
MKVPSFFFRVISTVSRDLLKKYKNAFCESTFTCISDRRRGLDWSVDLLTTYRWQLQMIITLLLISTLLITPHLVFSV